MQDRSTVVISVPDCVAQYDAHLLKIRGLSKSTRNLHRHVVHRLLSSSFASGHIVWSEFCVSDIVQFVTGEFQRLTSRATQQVWLMALRSFLRYLAAEEHVPGGWDAALPSLASRQHVQLPRGLTQQQVSALWTASEGSRPRDLRNRALFLLFLRLGLRTEEVAALLPSDIDWRNGTLMVRSAKTHRVRTLPLAQDVGEAVATYLRSLSARPTRLFDPTRKPPVPAHWRR
jgi:site-specific recombinase XerD